jgi:hypothetical protein
MDGVAENFHIEQNRELSNAWPRKPEAATGNPQRPQKLADAIPFSEAGVTVRETKDLWNLPLVFFLLLTLRFSEWWLRRKWGIVRRGACFSLPNFLPSHDQRERFRSPQTASSHLRDPITLPLSALSLLSALRC